MVPGYKITKLMANGTEERNLSSGITPVAGKFYNITLNKDKGYTDDGQGNYTVTSAEGLKNIAKLVNEEWKERRMEVRHQYHPDRQHRPEGHRLDTDRQR